MVYKVAYMKIPRLIGARACSLCKNWLCYVLVKDTLQICYKLPQSALFQTYSGKLQFFKGYVSRKYVINNQHSHAMALYAEYS